MDLSCKEESTPVSRRPTPDQTGDGRRATVVKRAAARDSQAASLPPGMG